MLQPLPSNIVSNKFPKNSAEISTGGRATALALPQKSGPFPFQPLLLKTRGLQRGFASSLQAIPASGPLLEGVGDCTENRGFGDQNQDLKL